MSKNDQVDALIHLITTVFADNPHLSRQSLVHKGAWETRSLIRSLAVVKDVPDDAFIERHFDSLPVFRPEGLRQVLPYYMTYSLRHPQSDATERVIFHLSPADTAQKNAVREYWAGEGGPSSDPDYFVALHVEHLLEWRLKGMKYLGLPPGWRFLTDGTHDEVWEDASLLDI